jgi:predicted MFS family arabinose efflux permease
MEPGGIGRFFGTIRSFWHLALIFYYLGAQAWLDVRPDGFGALFAVAWLCGVLRLGFIARLPERGERTGERIRVREAFALIRESEHLRAYLIGTTWAAATRMSVLPFVIVMMRREIGISAAEVLLTTAASFAGGLVSLYVWGYVVDRVGPSPVFRTTSLGLAALTLALVAVQGPGPATLAGLVAFFFFYTVLVSGFGVADTHVLFGLTPPEAPARTLVVASVVVGTLSSLAPIAIGFILEAGIESAAEPLFVYHVFFAAAAFVQAFAYLPLRGLGESRDSERTGRSIDP